MHNKLTAYWYWWCSAHYGFLQQCSLARPTTECITQHISFLNYRTWTTRNAELRNFPTGNLRKDSLQNFRKIPVGHGFKSIEFCPSRVDRLWSAQSTKVNVNKIALSSAVFLKEHLQKNEQIHCIADCRMR
jgi:hypothetical protein